jgi:thymidine phosphorylase
LLFFIASIVASIISKKAAERVDALVLDVKCGNASFNKTEEVARELAQMILVNVIPQLFILKQQ